MEDKILEILRRVLKRSDLDKSCSQKTCAEWDSMNQLNVVLALESEYGIVLEPEEIGQMVSFDDVVRIVTSKLS